MRATYLIAGLMMASAGSGQPAATTIFDPVSDSRTTDSTTQAEEIRLSQDNSARMTVPVQVSGQGPYRFLVDTGADRTAVSRRLASQLSLPPSTSVRLHSVSGASTVETASIPRLEVGRRKFDIVQAPVLESAHMGADGILGTDSLRSQRVVFDFKSGSMTVVPAVQRLAPGDEDSIVVTGRLKRGRLILSHADIDGQRAAVIVDTGSDTSIGNAALRKRLLGNRPVSPSSLVMMQSVTGGTLVGEMIRVKSLDLGGVRIEDLTIVFAEAHTFGQLGFDRRPSLLLGIDALRAFEKVSIDFANKKLRLLLPEHSSLPVMMASL